MPIFYFYSKLEYFFYFNNPKEQIIILNKIYLIRNAYKHKILFEE